MTCMVCSIHIRYADEWGTHGGTKAQSRQRDKTKDVLHGASREGEHTAMIGILPVGHERLKAETARERKAWTHG